MIKRLSGSIIAIMLFLLTPGLLMSQTVIRGIVVEEETGKPVGMAAVVAGSGKGTVTGSDGTFTLQVPESGTVVINVSCLGYISVRKEIVLPQKAGETIRIELKAGYVAGDEITVTATRSEVAIRSVPARVDIIGRASIVQIPATTTDELLFMAPGMNISRSHGIYSHKSSVTMRGLSGNEQGRVLVMINGVPVNKSDGGSVNWNLINPDIIERIEIVKGPGSSLYGGNAMGGAINIITVTPREAFGGRVNVGYSTYNTPSGSVYLSGRNKEGQGNFYWMANGFYRKSRGYITHSEADRLANPYVTKSSMEEMGAGIKTGYEFNSRNSLELDILAYDDYRGGGVIIYQPMGTTTDHDTWQTRLMYKGASGNLSWNVNMFASQENYKKVNESMKDDYTWYEVLSKRSDLGILSSGIWQTGSSNRLTFGFDIRDGRVDASDVYYTSTDIVTNRGKMLISGLFLQDELSLADNHVRIVTALRFDHATYRDGAFIIDGPSGETQFMAHLVNDNMKKVRWNAVSPKVSALYMFTDNTRVYASWARGFRQPVLDELCRTGRIKGGLKIANPSLGPETIDNFELGADLTLSPRFNASVSLYRSLGHDFMYYVNTGDSLDMGFGFRPILNRENISGIAVNGAEVRADYQAGRKLSIGGAYAWTHSIISAFDMSSDYPANLEGKFLTDVPAHSGMLRAGWTESFGSASVVAKYIGKMWINDLNQYDDIVGGDRYPDYLTVDVRLSGRYKMFSASLSIQNTMNKLFYDSKGAVCPGRFITVETGVKF